MDELTRLLAAIDTGQEYATDDLLPLVYAELRKLAAARLALEPAGQTLQPTALVHEAYLRLIHGHSPEEQANGNDSSRIEENHDQCEVDHLRSPRHGPQWKSRAQFFAAAAITIRRILIDHARRKKSLKHGGEFVRHNIDDFPPCLVEPQEDLLALDEALIKLADLKPQGAELVQLLYFGGLTLAEAAETMDISIRTASRLWAYSRAWLRRELTDSTTSVTE